MWHLLDFQSYLKQHIVDHTAEDEMYVLIKDKLQQQSLQKRYEGYKLEEDELLNYKNIIHIPNVADPRRILMDEIHQAPYFGHLGYQKTIATAISSIFGQE